MGKFTDTLLQTLNESTAWKKRSDAQDYCDTMNDVYGLKCHPVQVGKEWDYWQVEYAGQNKMTEGTKDDGSFSDEAKEAIKQYPYIYAWHARSAPSYVSNLALKAKKENAPKDAVFYDTNDKKWVALKDVNSPEQTKLVKGIVKKNAILKNILKESINEDGTAEQVAKKATDSLVTSLDESVDNAIDDIANNIVGDKTKQIVADNLRDDLENFSKDIESSDDFIETIVDQLEEELKKSLSESFKVNVKKDALKGLEDLVNKEVIKVQFKDEDDKFAV